MKREWKAGDVAMLSGLDGDEVMAIRQERQWVTVSHLYLNDWQVNARPLVVIDPEDREAVERLVKVLSTGQPLIGLDPTNRKIVDEAWISHTQTALREFANPTQPRPEEPLGLGAVVEDATEKVHIRISRDLSNPWLSFDGKQRHYDAIAAVRVLSPGYTEGGAA